MKVIDYPMLKNSSTEELRALAKELELEAYMNADTDMEDVYMNDLELVEDELKTRVKEFTPSYWTEERLSYFKANIDNPKSTFPAEHLAEMIEHLLIKDWFEIAKGESFIRFQHGTRTINFYTWEENVYITYHKN